MINHLKLRWKITIIVIIILLLIMIVVSTSNYFLTTNIIRDEVTSNIQTTFSLFNIRVNNFFDEIEKNTNKITNNDSVITYLEIVNFRYQQLIKTQNLLNNSDLISEVNSEQLKINSIINSDLERYIANISWSEINSVSSVDFFYITLNNGYVVAESYRESIPNFTNKQRGTQLSEKDYRGKDLNSIKYFNNSPYLLIKNTIHNYNDNIIGYLVVGLSLDKFNQQINFNIGAYSDNVSILNQNKRIISNQNSDKLATFNYNKNIINNINNNTFPVNNIYNEEFLIIDKIADKNLYLVGELEKSNVFAPAEKIRTINIIILIAAIILTFFIIYITMRWQLHPLNKLVNKMQEIKDGNLDTKLEIKANDEIGVLTKEFNNMIAELKKLMRKVKEDQEEIRKLELSALQQQINPHFLYNTLDSISLMTKTGEYDEIAEMCISLSQFFRLGLNKGKECYTIKEEINHVKNYINIQKLRFPDKFEYSFEIDENIYNYRCVKIILQPLIENSLKHGFKFNKSKGHILIKAFKDNNKIILQIIDDGSGFRNEFIKKFNTRNSKNGYGLNNVRRRIELYHGKDYGLIIYNSQKTGGAIVTITLPITEKGVN
ncbi:histidine kinase/DNA gyrase B/HSP90-like ATPase [Halanaerobium saccharolyticum]|uniref:histidine kinase n=1 Tax=Halanaerobium saccharolyticum TaxID=43595 RepID=A0A4R7Z541_9FIRM|nr:sensor histidine kinase [Halanaerobium saccharolyticum]RAK07833.1 histidine kinase/DNA gyrase B/HSP90-like ATPase [Halanaerobium saccharolyticum]TDW04447.1 histidine kinase/DNA gyrase B/HSP90-like ATPase [Halanaerobium saccharolyticum]TDX59783.1 histidine kinase/DNA gyrase B/HSP90-like ATPase [Halanaerobium saccharolyticum]